LIEYKGGACQICGYDKPIPSAYDFHHRDPSQKDFGISGKTKNFELLKAETDKCDLVCKNCHAEIHHNITKQKRKENGLPHLEHILTCANPECGKKFTRTKYGQEYCTKICYWSITKTRCRTCGKVIIKKAEDHIYCDKECQDFGRRKTKWPTQDELKNLCSLYNNVELGIKFGVSEACIRKWKKIYNI
jgi:hypothetical protein